MAENLVQAFTFHSHKKKKSLCGCKRATLSCLESKAVPSGLGFIEPDFRAGAKIPSTELVPKGHQKVLLCQSHKTL